MTDGTLVLALNCGSSSLKFQVVALDPAGDRAHERRLARGRIDRVGGEANLAFGIEGGSATRETASIPDHATGLRRVLDWITESGGALSGIRASGFQAIGHRVVHGGERFTQPVIMDDTVIAAIEALETLAPLHNAPSLAGVQACRALLGAEIPMVAVFDTAFHASLPERAHRYAIPYELSLKHGIRRYGFHGTSYRYLVSRFAEITGTRSDRSTVIALHLGNGCSIAAINAGRSLDTSMGFTPLEGLVMGTRSGDLDPAIVGYLARVEQASSTEIEDWLNHRSGLLGLSGVSHDIRDLLDRERDDARARLAIEIFCYRARKYIGAYLAALGGADAVLFSGGIGENQPETRNRICDGMGWCGLAIDAERNRSAIGREALISADDARIRVWVIPTDEEVMIARDTAECLARSHNVASPEARQERS